MARKSFFERSQSCLLHAAEDFCRADNEVQEARRLWRELKAKHDPYDGFCLEVAKSRSECCKECLKFLNSSPPDYDYALYSRRAAKTRMKRAFKNLLVARGTGERK